MTDGDPFELQRFVEAQEYIYEQALAELKAGRKRSHWMWFIFPQIIRLGFSEMSIRYAIRSGAEARAYLAHPLLGVRLKDCTQAMLQVEGRSAREILGSPDDMKFRSSMTLFAEAVPDEDMFSIALARYFEGKRDPLTLERLD